MRLTARTAAVWFLAGLVTAGGCKPPAQSMSGDHEFLAAPPGAMSVYQLAGSLNLRVRENGRAMATLIDRDNTVVLYPSPGGAAYVNGQPVQVAGDITPVGDTLFVPEGLAEQMRSLLRRVAPPPRPAAASPPPVPHMPVETAGHTIFIDAGHGGKDPGASSMIGIQEKALVLDTALTLANSLQRENVRAVMARGSDKFVELNDRSDLANHAGVEAFVSIHADHCPNPRISGFTIYVARTASAQSLALARAMERELGRAGVTSRGIQRADYRVLCRTTCPAVLVELGYLSNLAESRKLAMPDYRRQLAEAVGRGVVSYLNR